MNENEPVKITTRSGGADEPAAEKNIQKETVLSEEKPLKTRRAKNHDSDKT